MATQVTPTLPITEVARLAAGLYDLQLGNETMNWVLDAIDQNPTYGGSVATLVQQVYNRDFGGMASTAVAALVVENLGITEGAGASADLVDYCVDYVATELTNAGVGHEAAMLLAIVNGYAKLTSHPELGEFATAYNTQISAALVHAQTADTIDELVHVDDGLAFNITALEAAGADVMHLTGNQDVRIDFTNPDHQITGLDIDGDGEIEFNGMERTATYLEANVAEVGANHAGFEIVDAYSRNPLDHTDTANNFLGDIYFDGSSFQGSEGDGSGTDGNIFLGGLGNDTALTGVGNDFLAGGGVAELDGGDYLAGGRNADFFFGEFSLLDNVDGGSTLYVDGGNSSDDQPAGKVQSDMDSDWFLLEASDDDEPVVVVLSEESGAVIDDDVNVTTRSGEDMDLDDVENFDGSGNLYGFIDDLLDSEGNQLRIGGRATDLRYADGELQGNHNYGIGSSAQLDITGSEVGNIIIGGYDNDYIDGAAGNDLLFGGNLQQLFETVDGGATNVNLAEITLDGLDDLIGGDGNDGLVFEADGGIASAGAGTDTLWLTNYGLGTAAAADATTDGVLRFDLGGQDDKAGADADAELGFAGYGGANRAGTADQTNYSGTTDNKFVAVDGIEIVDATGLSTGVRGLDYFSAGTNDPDLSFENRQNFGGYDGDLDLRGNLDVDNKLYSGAGDDILEGRGGSDAAAESLTAYDVELMGGAGDDDFYFALDGDDSEDETNIIRAKVDADGDGFWDGSDAKGTSGAWGQDFGLDPTTTLGESVLRIVIQKVGGNAAGDELGDVVNRVSEIVTGVKVGGEFVGITLDTADIRAADTYADLVDAINAALDETDFGDDLQATLQDDGVTIFISDAQGRELADADSEVDGAGVSVSQIANTQTENIFEFGEPEAIVSQDRLIFKAYEDRSDNEGVDDDAITGSTISLGTDAYAEDLVVSFDADGTRIAEDQDYIITFTNLTTQDKVKITVNGVTYELTVGVANNGSLIDGEDTRHTSLEDIQSNFLTRLTGFIDSFMDDDTAAGQVDARVITGVDLNGDGDMVDAGEAAAIARIGLTQVVYHDGEETVFMSAPVVDTTGTGAQGSGGEKWTAAVDNDAQTEVFLYKFDGTDNNLNASNVLFWGQEEVSRSTLETALNAGDTIVGSEAVVIDGGHGAGDDDLDNVDGSDIPHNLATDDGEIDWDAVTEFQVENFAVHGDDYLIGGDGDDTISGMTGDDRVRGSLGNDTLDGGKDWYAVLDLNETDYHLEYLNAFEAKERDADGNVLDIQLVLQTESGHSLIAPTDDSPDENYEPYFDDTLIYQQADFTAGVTRFTITLNDYDGEGEDIVFNHGGAGTVGVDANGDGVIEADNVSTFTNFENIRTVAGTGLAVAGANGGQGRDTLNVVALSDDSDVGVRYDMTGDDATGGDVTLLEDLNDDDAVDNERVVIKVDGVENVVFGNGDDVLLIDETEAAKDNDITGDDGDDLIVYSNDFPDEDEEGDDEPTVTINVGPAHTAGSNSSLDTVVMTEGRVGTVVATDTLRGIEEITLDGNTAAGVREDDELNVENLSGGATVNYATGEVFSDTDGDLDFDDGVLQLTVNNLFEVEFVVADGKDAVVVGDADIMSDNTRTDTETEQLIIDSYLNYDLLDERGDAPERLTIADLRGIDGGTADTADEDDIPEGYNFSQFNFELGQDTDTVDYSETNDAINAVIDVSLTSETQYIMVDSDGGAFDGVDDAEADRVDALVSVERVVASTGESVLDFTASDSDIEVTFQYTIDADTVLNADDGYSETNAVRIADGSGDTIEGLTSFIERYTAEDGVVTNATWNRVEGSDNNETIIYEGSENLVDQNAVDHRFSDDTLTLRGGANTVSYSPLETSITAEIAINEYDAADPTAGQIDVTVDFQDGDGAALVGGGTHTITSYAADNEIAAGSLKLEASQDAEDTVSFVGDTGKLLILGQSPGVLTVDVGDVGAMVLTGFEFIMDSNGDDTYDFRDLDNIDGDIELIDSPTDEGAGDITTDHDTIAVYDDAIGFDSAPADTISLEVLNDVFRMDFDVLDVTGVEDNNLLLVGDDDDHDDDLVLNKADADYDADFDHLADYDRDGDADNRDTVDDVIVGDLDLIDDITLFSSLWLTDDSIDSAGDTYELDIDAGELLDGDGDLIFTYDGTGLNFSMVTDGVTVSVTDDGAAGADVVGSGADDSITGGGGDDFITGGGGADDLDGGVVPAVGAQLVQSFAGATFDSGTEAGLGEIFNLLAVDTNLFADATPELADLFDYVDGSDIDQIGAIWESLSLATWITAFDNSGLTTVEAGALIDVSYNAATNELTFDFAANAAGSTITAADLLGASFIGDNGDAVLTGGEAATGFVAQVDSADTFVYEAASDSTASDMDSISNFDDTDVIDLSAVNTDSLALALVNGGTVDYGTFDITDIFTGADTGTFQVVYTTDGTDARLFIDTDGDDDLDMVIELVGETDTTAVDNAGDYAV